MDGILELLRQNEATIRGWALEAPAVAALAAILYLILKRNVFGPLTEILDRRAATIAGAAHAEREAAERLDHASRRHEEALRHAYAEAAKVRDAERAAAQKEADSVLAAARTGAETRLREALVRLEAETDAGRTVLEHESHDLARVLVTRLVEGKGAGA